MANQTTPNVNGTVTGRNGRKLPNLIVRAFDRDMRSEELLGEAVTDSNGRYLIVYSPERFARAEKRSADLSMKVFSASGKVLLYETTLDRVVFNASASETIDINVTAEIKFEDNEFDAIMREIAVLIGEVKVPDLEETDARRDLTFLSKETGIDIQKLQYIVVAHRLARESQADAAFFYALLRKNTLLKADFTKVLQVRLFIDVGTEVKPLLYDAAMTAEDVIRRDVKEAVEELIVPARAVKELKRNLDVLQKFRREGEEFYRNEYPKKVLDLLTGFFVENKIAEIGRIFEENKHDLEAFFKKITDPAFFKSDPKAADARITMALAELLGFDQAVISQVKQLPAIKQTTDVRELARLNKAEWTEVLTKSADKIKTPGKKLNKDLIGFQASSLARKFEKEFPTVAFSAQLERAGEPILQNQKAINSFLRKNRDFDLQKNNVDLFLKEKKLTGDKNAAMGEELKSVQRVFKLVPRFSETNALLQKKADSAHSIAAMGETQFVNEIAPEAGIGEKEATEIFQKAERTSTAAMLIAGELQDTMRAMDVPALEMSSLPEAVSTVLADFPNLKSLFKLADTCACQHCRSVYSPAAYLVEILQFLDKRRVTDSSGQQGNAKVELFKRRPGLGEIDLGCENANTPLPYIDLVCELLEEAIAPDPGFLYNTGALTVGSTAANPAAGVISPALLSALTGAGFPVTAGAQIFMTETGSGTSGPFYLRDAKAVCKITSNSGGGFTVKRLSQTLSTTAELAAAPEYVNTNAYNLLKNSSFAFKLPFDLDFTEAKAYFSRFGINRYQLMYDFQGPVPADKFIAAEMLGLTDSERNLIVHQNVAGQPAFWNTTANASGDLANVDTFLTKSGLTYTELNLLLSLKYIDQNDHVFIFHPDLSCDTSGKTIKNLTDTVLDRIHRFLRLQKKTGWKFETLDEIISQPNLGNLDLNDACLIKASRLATVSKETGIPLETLVGFYGEIPHTPLTDDSGKPLYHRIFLNKAANGFIDESLLPTNVDGTKVFLPATATTAPSKTVVSVCLQISEQDLEKLIVILPDGKLNFRNLSALLAASTLMRKLRLSADNFLILRELTGFAVESSPQATLDFIRAAAASKQAPIKPADVKFILRHEAVNLADREIKDARITQVLEKARADFEKAALANRSPYDNKVTADEQKEALQDLLSKLSGLGEEDVKTMGGFVDGDWITPAGAHTFVDAKLLPLFNTNSINNRITALAAAKTSASVPNPSPAALALFQSRRKNLVRTFMASISNFLFRSEIRNLLYEVIAAAFKVDAALAHVVLDNAKLLQPGSTLGSLRDILLSNSLINTPITPAAFPAKYNVFRLLHKLFPLINALKLSSDDVAWHLQNDGPLGWLRLDGIPYQVGQLPVNYFAYTVFLDVLSAAADLTPVPDPSDVENPMTLHRLAEMTLPGSPTLRSEWIEAYALLSGYSKTDISAIDNHLFTTFNIGNYRDPKTWKTIENCAASVIKLSCTVAQAVDLTKPVLTHADTELLRAALKARYDADAWLDTLKQITDAVRPRKRDALVAYMLATDPSFKDENSLFNHYLIDVEMESCLPSSRIVQAHNTVQTFVQRCLMGLEPQAAADVSIDSKWVQWKWMKNYRVWEANRKVFLYPENWIEPDLRDDKSFLFREMEEELLQNELNDFNAEQALIKYIEKLDNIAFLEVVATWYQTDNYTMHIFARTKGGDPASYFYRKLEQERYFTPWEKVELDITGNHLLAYFRNNRLCLAWPIFSDVQDPDPQVVIPGGGSGTPVPLDKPRRRTEIKIAVSEFANNQWQPKKISAEGINTPSYYTSDPLPKESYNLMYLEQTEQIMIFSSRFSGGEYHQLNGTFNIAGCKGYPEPVFEGDRPLQDFYPDFKDSVLSAQRYKELGSDNSDDLAVSNAFSFTGFSPLLTKTPGNFRLTYPHQITKIDEVAYLLQFLMLLLRNGSFSFFTVYIVRGTLLPYFMEDSDHAYVIIPGFYGENKDPKNPDLHVQVKHTGSDILQLLEDICALQAKYVALQAQNPENNVFQEMTRDNDYQQITRRIEICKTLTYSEEFKVLYHPLVCSLRKTLYNHGIPEFMKRETQQRVTPFNFASHYQPAPRVVQPYPLENIDFSSGGSYSAYNWEMFFHVPFLLATRLSKNQKFEDSMKWFHLMFDPTGALPGPVPQKYWMTKPFFETLDQDYIAQRIDNLLRRIADPATPELTDLKFAVDQWRAKPFLPHAIARFRTVSYQKALLMKYIDNLIEWGDYLFRQDTMETIAEATQLYIMADQLLGPKPRIIPAPVNPPYETYNQIEAKLDAFGNALIDLENILPDLTALPEDGAELQAPLSMATLYFCIPQNDQMLEYWNRIENRLFNIRHCRDIDGLERSLALFASPIDPGALVRAAASGLDMSSILAGMNSPTPFYRFNTFAQKATELVQEVRGLGNSLLQAMEKKDAEAMALLRNELEIKVLNAVTEMKELSIKEAAEQIKALKLTKAMTDERHKFYASIEKMLPNEQLNLDKLAESHKFQKASQISQALVGIMGLIPDLIGGASGFGGSPYFTIDWGGRNLAAAARSASDVLNILSSVASYEASRASILGGYDRREADWALQERLAKRELDQIDQQIVGAEIRKQTAETDLKNHKLQIENAKKTDDFMRSKYTNKQLYEWMIAQVSSVYFRAYQLAYDSAKKAERCYKFELGIDNTFIGFGYWDNLKKGLQSADLLLHDIKRMEMSYFDQNKREYELTKHISLALLDPLALLKLRETGSCNFDVPEALYDMDHPGHYFRRLKSVSVSLPCIAGPYTSVSAKLSLTGNRYRKNNAQTPESDPYAEIEGNDERFVYNVGAIQSIATSNAQNDSGMFELNFRDERYLRFEGCGAISSWRLELPEEIRQFDYETIADVVLHVKYTSREGGSGLKNMAVAKLISRLNEIKENLGKTGLHMALNMRHDMPNEWHLFKTNGTVDLNIGRSRLPYFVQALSESVGTVVSLDAVTFLANVAGPGPYSLKIAGIDPVPLEADDRLGSLLRGEITGVALDTDFTLAPSASDPLPLADLEDLMMIVSYKFN